jgi:hypothetical protein
MRRCRDADSAGARFELRSEVRCGYGTAERACYDGCRILARSASEWKPLITSPLAGASGW